MNAVWNVGRGRRTTFPRLDKNVDVDVAIIGGGATGLAAALILSDAGERVTVLESKEVGSGSTGNSTGNLYSTLSGGLTAVRKKWDHYTVNLVVGLRRQALDGIQRNVERLAIDCQFQRRALHLCLQEVDGQQRQRLEEECQVAVSAGLDAELLEQPTGLGLPLQLALRIQNQAQYNPLLYCDGLAKGVASQGGSIYEHSGVVDVDPGEGKVTTAGGVVRAGHIVFATHTPKGVNMLQAEMDVYREHGIAAPLRDDGGDYPQGIFWIMDGFYSVRSYQWEGQTYLVVIGAKHHTGQGELGEAYYAQLGDYANRHFALGGVSHRWSAQQYQAADLLPYIGRSGHDNVYVGTGYAADGLVWSEVAAEIISHQILGRKDLDSGLLSPRRFTPAKSAKAWLETNTKVARHLSTDRFSVEKVENIDSLEPGAGKVVKMAGDNYAIYKSPEGRVSALSPVCPHMKCMVHWNGADKSWDCPCHGSRFGLEGEVIEGPAYRGLEHRQLPS